MTVLTATLTVADSTSPDIQFHSLHFPSILLVISLTVLRIYTLTLAPQYFAPLHLHLCDCTSTPYTSAPAPLHLHLCACTSTPYTSPIALQHLTPQHLAPLHLHLCTCTSALAPYTLHLCTSAPCTTAPYTLHLCTSAPQHLSTVHCSTLHFCACTFISLHPVASLFLV